MHIRKLIAKTTNKQQPKIIDKKLPDYYALLTGSIEDPEVRQKVRMDFMSYFYCCLDSQLIKAGKDVDVSKTFFVNWLVENSDYSQNVYEEVRDNIAENILETIAYSLASVSIGVINVGLDIAGDFKEYHDIVINAVSTAISLRRKGEILYLRAYLRVLEEEYKGDQTMIEIAKVECDAILNSDSFGADPLEIRKYAERIFAIEHNISIDFLKQ